jgi:hypothetical protein
LRTAGDALGHYSARGKRREPMMMDCESFKAVVHEIDKPGCLEASALDAAWGHAQACARCARRLARARELAAALCALARADEPRQAPLQVEAQLLRLFRTHRKAARKMTRRNLAWWMAAAAIVALMIGGGLAWRRASKHTRGRAPAVAAIRSAPVAPKLPSENPVGPAPREGRYRRLRHSPQVAKMYAPPPEPEQVAELAGFLPLPFADDDSPLGTAEVVRIRVSESALGLLGLPVSEEASRQPVTADVVIGDDGVARAIRFISGPVPSEVVQELQTMAFENKGAKP